MIIWLGKDANHTINNLKLELFYSLTESILTE